MRSGRLGARSGPGWGADRDGRWPALPARPPRTSLIGFPAPDLLFIAEEAERRFPFRSSPRVRQGRARTCRRAGPPRLLPGPAGPGRGGSPGAAAASRAEPSPLIHSSPSLDASGGSLSAFGITWERGSRSLPVTVRECSQGRLPAGPQARAASHHGEPPPRPLPGQSGSRPRGGGSALGPTRVPELVGTALPPRGAEPAGVQAPAPPGELIGAAHPRCRRGARDTRAATAASVRGCRRGGKSLGPGTGEKGLPAAPTRSRGPELPDSGGIQFRLLALSRA